MTDAIAHDWTGISDPVDREAARTRAYAALFSTPLGRLILLDLLIDAQVFGVRGRPGENPGDGEYLAGRRDHAVEIAVLAGVDDQHLARALTTGNEGALYDRPTDFD